ncbi:MAG: YdaS family helix-turn-helix protein [Leptospirales bacterium]
MTPLEKAVQFLGGYSATGRICGVSFMSVMKWIRKGRLPRTEWTGETDYAAKIEKALDGTVTREELRSVGFPVCASDEEAKEL